MKNSIRIKIALIVALIITAIMTLFETYSYINQRDEKIINLESKTNNVAERVKTNLVLTAWSVIDPDELLNSISRQMSSSIIEGELSDNEITAIIVYSNFGQLYMGKLQLEKGAILNYSPTEHDAFLETQFYTISKDITNRGISIGLVTVYANNNALKKDLNALLARTVVKGMILVAVIVISLFIIIKLLILDSITLLTNSIREIDRKNYDLKLPERSKDEIGRLIESFNSMALQLKRSIDEITGYKNELEKRVDERTRELQDALDNVKTLKGFIPICSNCKKVRNDKGYWEQVEAYINSHSEIEFSHGLCPDCAKQLYPSLYKDEVK